MQCAVEATARGAKEFPHIVDLVVWHWQGRWARTDVAADGRLVEWAIIRLWQRAGAMSTRRKVGHRLCQLCIGGQ